MNRNNDSLLYVLSCLFLLGLIRVLAFPRFGRGPEPALEPVLVISQRSM